MCSCGFEGCNIKRFKRLGGMWVPVNSYYFFGVEATIQSLFANPDWAALQALGRDEVDNGFRGSPEFNRLNEVGYQSSLLDVVPRSAMTGLIIFGMLSGSLCMQGSP